MMNSSCPLCQTQTHRRLFQARGLPLFQNKVYDSEAAAMAAWVVAIVIW
jgi:hypothetical protein